MSAPNKKVVQIKQQTEQKNLSVAQKQFNTLIKNIEKQKKLLVEWQTVIAEYQFKVAGEYDVLWDTYNNHQIELVHLLDHSYDHPVFSKTDKAKIKHLISSLVFVLIDEHGKDELKALHNKYTGSDFDIDKQQADLAMSEFMKSMAEEVFGIDIDDDEDYSSPEKMQAIVQEKLQKLAIEDEMRLQANKRGKTTAKQRKKEMEQQQEEQNISKSIQEVFRKLAAVLHPDRESDLKERERKTEIMQRVNAAYAKKDLLQLLALQLEVEQIDQEHLNNIAENRLKYFNKILKGQLVGLQQEIAEIEYSFKQQLHLSPYERLTTKRLMHEIALEIEEVRESIFSIKQDIQIFQTPTALKQWLKSYKIPKKPRMDDMFPTGFMP